MGMLCTSVQQPGFKTRRDNTLILKVLLEQVPKWPHSIGQKFPERSDHFPPHGSAGAKFTIASHFTEECGAKGERVECE